LNIYIDLLDMQIAMMRVNPSAFITID